MSEKLSPSLEQQRKHEQEQCDAVNNLRGLVTSHRTQINSAHRAIGTLTASVIVLSAFTAGLLLHALSLNRQISALRTTIEQLVK